MRAPLILALSLFAALGFAQNHVRFIVTGDDRWETKTPRPGLDENGVNVTAMRSLSKAIIAEKPDMLLFNGDTIGGGDDAEETSQYKTFISVMKPMYDAGIHVLMIRGNHEMHAPHANDLWRATFTGPYANPQNGPAGEEDLTSSMTMGNSLFLGLDQFMTDKPIINQAWLDQTIAANPGKHVFAFAHKMAFKAGHHVDGMNTVPDQRDTFLESLASHGESIFFCGHDHLYDHLTASESGWPSGKVIHQVVVGTAGAPSYKGTSTEMTDGKWSITRLGHVEQRIGYCVVDVDGDKVSVVFKAEVAGSPGTFVVADSFTYTDTPAR